MASKKKAKKKGAQRACSVCSQLGHNKRSHKRGGKLYDGRRKPVR